MLGEVDDGHERAPAPGRGGRGGLRGRDLRGHRARLVLAQQRAVQLAQLVRRDRDREPVPVQLERWRRVLHARRARAAAEAQRQGAARAARRAPPDVELVVRERQRIRRYAAALRLPAHVLHVARSTHSQ